MTSRRWKRSLVGFFFAVKNGIVRSPFVLTLRDPFFGALGTMDFSDLWPHISSSFSPRPPSRRPNPIPAVTPYVVRTPHLHGAPTTEETSKKEKKKEKRKNRKMEKRKYGKNENFEQLTRQVTDKFGFTCGLWTPCVLVQGVRRELNDFFEQLKVHMWAKSEGVLGPDPGQEDVREVVCFNRVFRWCLPTSGGAEAIEIEANAMHVEILIHQLNLRSAKALASPGVKSTSSDIGPALPLEKHSSFRSMCTHASYLVEDRPDVRFACKEVDRLMSEPCEAGWEKLKRLGRYLAGVLRLVQRMERHNPPRCVLALSDSDHAGCLRTGRSTTCNVPMHGDHFLKMICSTQVPIALSSGESEWYALTHAGCAFIGQKNLCRDMERVLAAHMAGDASAASGIGARRGVGKI